ncbi:MAG: penicillin-insensitive murein endopeptidase [Kofleriaceae bacterium]|nr:penicillin-insensitive murein endopeptidase [Kofleriaceae bacterium]
MVRLLLAAAALLGGAACAELGVIDDGTSISIGKPSDGMLRAGKRLPDAGEGFMTRAVWRTRGNRYGTDEMIDLITGVGRRLATTSKIRLVVADLSSNRGGAAKKWHRSHQSGRDVDLVYFMRDKDGKPFEADAMRVFDREGRAVDGSGITVDIPRMWELVKALITAPEADVQWTFLYAPIAQKILDHALAIGEPELLVNRARMTLKQPGDSAPHNDHMHVRIYCSPHDRAFGCMDIGPLELLAERDAERREGKDLAARIAALSLEPAGPPSVASTLASAGPSGIAAAVGAPLEVCTAAPTMATSMSAASCPAPASTTVGTPITEPPGSALLRLLRAGFHPLLRR